MLTLILEIILWLLKIAEAVLKLLKYRGKEESRHSNQESKRD